MHRRSFLIANALIWLFVISGPFSAGIAQTAHAQEEAEATVEENQESPSLTTTQEAISRRYKRFEETLLKMAELMRKTDPDRAELLRRVIGKSKEQFITLRMDRLIELLENEQFGDAIDQQDDLIVELASILDLLGSEDRAQEIEEEKRRLKDLIRNVDMLLGKQKSIRADTERGAGAEGLKRRQEDLAEKTQKLGEKIDKQDQEKADELRGDQSEDKGDSSEGQTGKSESGEGGKSQEQPPEGENSDGEKSGDDPSESEKSQSENPEGEKSPGKSSEGEKSKGQPSEGQPSEGQPSEGQSSPGGESQPSQSNQQQQPSTPGRQEIEQARKAMEDALDKLKREQRDGAPQDQTDAIAKLQQAKEKLEEILRQLREEEREQLLTKLEDRFQQMLAVQLLIYDNTVALGKVPEGELESRQLSKAKDLSRKEAELVVEAEKALALLKDEGSSIAFPEAVEQMRDDMRTVVGRLDVAKVDELTQGIEEDIIEALEEMIEALQREIEEAQEKKQQQQQQQQQNQNQDPELIDELAELKMLRALQLRINRRTKRLGRLFDGEQATKPDILEQLRRLSARQKRIQEATHDLSTGKNE